MFARASEPSFGLPSVELLDRDGHCMIAHAKQLGWYCNIAAEPRWPLVGQDRESAWHSAPWMIRRGRKMPWDLMVSVKSLCVFRTFESIWEFTEAVVFTQKHIDTETIWNEDVGKAGILAGKWSLAIEIVLRTMMAKDVHRAMVRSMHIGLLHACWLLSQLPNLLRYKPSQSVRTNWAWCKNSRRLVGVLKHSHNFSNLERYLRHHLTL